MQGGDLMLELTPTAIPRPIQGGRVFCLIQQQPVGLGRCDGCQCLAAVAADDTNSLTEIICDPVRSC